ncbi:hypothetical protein JQ641_33675 [Bradyrhizobium sp. JYMT SZCCT0180]|nr:hypothetical protein [Bradyrhizobium sp. JYMT SZCCT0180]
MTVRWIRMCDAVIATNIASATWIGVDTVIETTVTIAAGTVRTTTVTIEATTMIALGGA